MRLLRHRAVLAAMMLLIAAPARAADITANFVGDGLVYSGGKINIAPGGITDAMLGLTTTGSGALTFATSPTFTTSILVTRSGGGANVTNRSYGGAPTFTGSAANGTSGTPTALSINSYLFQFAAAGYGATGFSGTRASIGVRASEAWNDANQGTYLVFYTTPTGSTTLTQALKITNNGKLQPTGPLTLPGYTVAGLPAGTVGDIAYITDANAACSYGTAPTGGGSTKCKVWYNGSAWVEG